MGDSESAGISCFKEFWPFYVSQHRRHWNRVLHFIGTTLGFLLLALAAASGRLMFVPWALVSGYGFAWFGHFVIEKNRPASFGHPFWAFAADMKMYALMWRGKMTAEADRLGLPDPTRPGHLASNSAS